MKLDFLKTVRFQFTASLLFALVLFVSSTLFTLYLINFRKHDYEILNLSGQLRIMSEEFVALSGNYLLNIDNQNEKSSELYLKTIKDRMDFYNKIIISFKTKKLLPEVTGKNEPITCTWDSQSISKLDLMALNWDNFQKNILNIINSNEKTKTKAEKLSSYIKQNGYILLDGSLNVSKGFQEMMEQKLSNVKKYNYFSIFSLSFIVIMLIFLMLKKIIVPLRKTVEGFKEVETGSLGHIVEVLTENEIGQMTISFNKLSKRIQSITKLIENINNLNKLEDTIEVIFKEFCKFISLDIAGLYILSPDGKSLQLEVSYSKKANNFSTKQEFHISKSFLNRIFKNENIIFSNDLGEFSKINKNCKLLINLLNNNIKSAIFIPISKKEITDKALLVFGSPNINAYPSIDIALIQNIYPQIIHSLEKSFLFENLIIATIEGLAKLAESRDPETGEHLVRMSNYSMIIAKKIAETDDKISFKYIRDIFKFAPMHDIGKVGVTDDVLLKKGKLNETEWDEMKTHPIVGGNVLEKCQEQVNITGKQIFKMGIEIAKYHHEKWNGTGYPYNLKENEIPLSARIVAVADVFDALTSKRPYKEPWTIEEAITEIKSLSGIHFDPFVVESLLNSMDNIKSIYNKYNKS